MSVFDDIYRENRWLGEESRSGPGSGTSATRAMAAELLGVVRSLGARSFLDVGCGDNFWMPDMPGYVGFDASPYALRLARAARPDRTFVSDFPAGPFDVVFCRDVVQHLSLASGSALVRRLVETAGSALITSTYLGSENVDLGFDGEDAYAPNLALPPFSLGDPDATIFDGHHYHEHGTDAVRDERKVLGIWRAAR